jgi:hypothetical protein
MSGDTVDRPCARASHFDNAHLFALRSARRRLPREKTIPTVLSQLLVTIAADRRTEHDCEFPFAPPGALREEMIGVTGAFVPF